MPDDRVTQLGRVAVAALAAVLREDDPPPRTRLSPGRAVAVGAVVGTLGRVAAQRGARLRRQRLDEHAERIAPQDERMPPMEGAMTRSEEELEARTGRRRRGRVRLRKYVVTEQVQRTIPARREEMHRGGPALDAGRRPGNRRGGAARHRGDRALQGGPGDREPGRAGGTGKGVKDTSVDEVHIAEQVRKEQIRVEHSTKR